MTDTSAVGPSLQIVGRRKLLHVRNTPKATAGGQSVLRRDGPEAVMGSFHFRLASGLAASRACWMKSFATGLSVRFFRVTIAAGTRAMGSSTGRTFSSGRLVRNSNEFAIVRKRPVASRLIRTSGELVTSVARG